VNAHFTRVKSGGYLYSRTLLMIINGLGFVITMVLVGMPVVFALPLSVFGSFVSVFIPVIGTYLGAAVRILVTLAVGRRIRQRPPRGRHRAR